jgi:predicted DNA-binding WGR domain protein
MRIVASGVWTYVVDLSAMKQTNITHPNQKCRFIRRVAPGAIPDDIPPGVIVAANVTAAAAASPVAAAVTCTVIAAGDMKATKTGLTKTKIAIGKGKAGPLHAVRPAPAATIVPPPPATLVPKKTSTVDADIALGKDKRSTSDFVVIEPYEILGNQTDIGKNANKYYRIQLLQETSGAGKFYVWTRWGRVGESTRAAMTALLGPYDEEVAAMSAYERKYMDKFGGS